MKLQLLLLALPILAVALSPAPGLAQVKVYISVDMEGIAGVVTDQQLGPEGFEYPRFRELMTDETLAAIRGARAAGATEVLVSDSHGNGQNLLIDRFPDDVQIVRSWPRPLGMMEGIDDSFAAALFIGYHASTTSSEGVRAHTFSSATLTDVKLNGKPVSEAAFNAAIAGQFGVPVVMISGDDAIAAEARRTIGEIETAVVKHAISFHSAKTMTPGAATKLIEATARKAVEKRQSIAPVRVSGDIALEVSFKSYRQAEMLSYLPIVERTGSHSIRYVAKDMVAISKFVEFMDGYASGLTP
jgi:D-amino peptidase